MYLEEIMMLIMLGLFVTHYILKAVISVFIFPAQLKNNVDFDIPQQENPEEGISIEKICINAAENRKLLTFVLTPKENIKGTIFIFNGQNSVINSRKLNVLVKMAKDTGYRIIGFNYGGSGKRKITTWSEQTLLDDVEYLVNTFKEERNFFPVIFKGNSLGGAIAIKSAVEMHANEIPVYVWSGRSFNSVADVLAGYLQTMFISGHFSLPVTITLANFFKPILDSLFTFYHFGMHTGEAYLRLPEEYKHCYSVHSSAEERLNGKKDDVIIPHTASLGENTEIKAQTQLLLSSEAEAVNSPKDIVFYRQHHEVSWRKNTNAHGAPETELRLSGGDQSVYDLFCLFAKEYVPSHHESKAASLPTPK